MGGQVQTRQVGADGSYLSQSAVDLHFGLGEHERIDDLEILWPDGSLEHHVPDAVDRLLVLVHDAKPAAPGPRR